MKLAAVVVLAMPAMALAEPALERATREASNANLASESIHEGKQFTVAAGGGLTIGLGVDDAVGGGGSISFRLGQMATERIGFTVELTSVVLRQKVAVNAGGMTDVKENVDSNLLVGAQFFVARSLWLRVATGLGVYVDNKLDRTLPGPAGLVGAGLDIVRKGRVAVGLETLGIGQINREGLLVTGGMLLNLAIE